MLWRPFSRMLVNGLPNRKYTTDQVQFKPFTRTWYTVIFYIFFSFEVPSRLSTNNFVLGERDRSEGLRWRQSPSWCIRSVVSHVNRRFHKSQFVNLYIDWFVSSRKLSNNWGRRECDCPDIGINTSSLFPGNNHVMKCQAKAARERRFVKMGLFLKTSMRNEASFCTYRGFGAWGIECKLLLFQSWKCAGGWRHSSGVLNFGAINDVSSALYTNRFTP